jgi:hypothetical protein
MATVLILRRWPDGDELMIRVKAETSYPDALSEALRTAINAYTEALGVTLGEADE